MPEVMTTAHLGRCTTVEDTTDLTGDHAERWQQWDSCALRAEQARAGRARGDEEVAAP
ncbi:hypothetical protein ABZ801_15440 [Actinomadura sp. NPDC047616]|uniref:hypothetical protein n=1 Tax=Actinomadura sp. NPDC047616 TaxID=3155914 RepID=UPI0033FDF6D7